MINITFYRTPLLALLFVVVIAQLYGQTPRPLAHYPLSAEEINVGAPFFTPHYAKIHVWDVSGNAHHGVLKNTYPGVHIPQNSNFMPGYESPSGSGVYSYDMQPGTFLNGTSCIKNDNVFNYSHIEIPDHFTGLSALENFTVSFWFKYASGVSGNFLNELIETKYFTISENVANPKRSLNIKSKFLSYEFDNFFSQGTGWYFVALSFEYAPNALNPQQLKAYRYYITDGGTYNSAESAMGSFTKAKNDKFDAFQTDCKILPSSSVGSIRDVRVYNSTLTKTQINDIRNRDWDWSKKDYKLGDYIEDGAYSHYPFENHLNDIGVRGSAGNGTASGSITYSIGQRGATAQFNGTNAYISTPNFFGSYDIKKGFTVSFWTKIDALLNYNCADTCRAPIDIDTEYQIFYAKNASNQTLLGMNRVLDWVGVNRYSRSGRNTAESGSGTLIPWNLWQYDPVSFNGQTGWYHVTLVYHPYYTRMFLAKPGSCTLETAYNYFGPQDLSNATQWGLGNPNGSPIKFLDEFRVYNWPLTDEEVAALHKTEDSDCTGDLIVRSEDGEESFEPVAQPAAITVYPNPTSGDLVVHLSNMSEGTAQMRLFDLSGKLIFQRKEALMEGTQDVSLGNLKIQGINSGMYFLQVYTPNKQSTIKIVVQ